MSAGRPIEFVVVHEAPHFDEIFAYRLYTRHGRNLHPGIETAKFIYCQNGNGDLDPSIDRNRCLFLGLAGAECDEHSRNGQPGKNGECSATLAAKLLGVADDPILEPLLEYALRSDTKTGNPWYEWSSSIKALHRLYPGDPNRVVGIALDLIDSAIRDQEEFFGQAKADFDRNSHVIHIYGGAKQRLIKVAVVHSDTDMMPRYARWAKGGNADIVVKRESTGHVQIFGNWKCGINFADVVRLLRAGELRAKHKPVGRWEDMERESGGPPDVPEWFFYKRGPFVFNRSKTATEVPPTQLTDDQIVGMIQKAADPWSFVPRDRRAGLCLSGICTADQRRCPVYHDGMFFCRSNRGWLADMASRYEQQAV